MTQDRLATPDEASSSHPAFVCPRCERRTGMVNTATGISECRLCGTEWKGPRLLLFDPKDLETPEGLDEVVRQINAEIDRTGARDQNSGAIEGDPR